MKRAKATKVLLSRARLDKHTQCWLYAELPPRRQDDCTHTNGRFLLRVHAAGRRAPVRTTFTIAYGYSTSLNAFCAGEGLAVYARHFERNPDLEREVLLAAIEWARKTLVAMCERDVLRQKKVDIAGEGHLTVWYKKGYVREIMYTDASRRLWVAPDRSGTWETCLNDALYMVRTLCDDRHRRGLCAEIVAMYTERLFSV